jgi:hydroxyacylglutathione hydrolase
MKVECYVLGPLANNVYLVVDEETQEAAILDPGIESEPALDHIREGGWNLRYVINTHGHIDHVYCDAFFMAETGASLLIHADDVPVLEAADEQAEWLGCDPPERPVPTRLLQDGDRIDIGKLVFTVLHTPGHTPGGICLLGDGVLFSGDTLFAGSIGRTDLPGGDYGTLLRTLRDRILPLPDETVVCPGHGQRTTIGWERQMNPFLVGI